MKPAFAFAALFTLTFLPSPGLRAAAWTEPLNQISKVGAEGAGNVEAAQAWSDLTAQGSEIIVPVLSAMETAGPLARNWMRSAVETVFEREVAAAAEIPAADIKNFLQDRDNEPNARRLAFDLYQKLAPEDAEAIIPTFVDDPSPALRRESIARLISQGQDHLKEGKTDQSTKVLKEALDAAREVDQIKEIAELLREELEQPVDLPRQFGFLMYWHLIAPFDNTGHEGFDTAYPPEEAIQLNASYPGKEDIGASWQAYSTSDDYGMVDFNQPFSPLKEVVGYAYTEFESGADQAVELRLGCKNAWKIWLNDKLIFGRDEYHRGISIDQYQLPIRLKKGKNTLLVKACQDEQEEDWTNEWQFQLRVCDSSGTAILSTDRKPTPSSTAPSRRRGE
tara:strand:+ start:3818 stop:4996 length:1179 start_codon:yes stop_codon:yes gene_type:complete